MSGAERSGYCIHPSPTATLDDLYNLGSRTVLAWLLCLRPVPFTAVPVWWQVLEEERFRAFDAVQLDPELVAGLVFEG